MALMEYCLVNIVLGDTAIPKPLPIQPTEQQKFEKIFELASKVSYIFNKFFFKKK